MSYIFVPKSFYLINQKRISLSNLAINPMFIQLVTVVNVNSFVYFWPQITTTKMPQNKVPPNYFLYPEFLAFVMLPVTWGLLPVASFRPELFVNYVPPAVLAAIINAQVSGSYSDNWYRSVGWNQKMNTCLGTIIWWDTIDSPTVK